MDADSRAVGSKRPADASSGAGAGAASSSSSAVNTPAPKKSGGAEVFNPVMLKYYYQHLFPFKDMFRWLSYGNDPALKNVPGNKTDFFYKREFTYTLENDVFVRYVCFQNAEEFARRTIERNPERIEIGPVYTAPPDKVKTLQKDVFKPVERELIFDIDLNDYDDIRTCCVGATICKKCWSFMNVAIRVLDETLRSDFGFQHIMFVYSGRRGVHCHVCDDAARKLTNEERSALAEYINAMSADSNGVATGKQDGSGKERDTEGATNINRVLNGLTVPLHPMASRAYRELEDVWVRDVIGDNGQKILSSSQQWVKILDMLPTLPEDTVINGEAFDLRDAVERAWNRKDNNPKRRWAQLKSIVEEVVIKSGGGLKDPKSKSAKREVNLPYKTREALEKLIPAIIFTYIYPRLDIEVSKHRNHLLKAPFCIHPKTGRVCVPIDITALDDFDPAEVPVLPDIMEEGMAFARSSAGSAAAAAGSIGGLDSTLWEQTSVSPYRQQFREFVDNMHEGIRRQRREAAARAEARFADF